LDLSTDLGGFASPEIPAVTPPRLSSIWATRRARALRLATELPHAEELLCTYAELLHVQARVAEAVPLRRWLTFVSAEAGPPRLRLDRLPVDELVPLFADFLAGASGLGSEVMQTDAGLLCGAPGASWLALIGAALAPDAGDDKPPFHVLAFLQPVATALATAEGDPVAASKGGRCLVCGGAPAVGALEDLPGDSESHSLVCAVCGTAWRRPRAACVHCGEDDPVKLRMYEAESAPWVHIDACATCRRYLKVVDLRVNPEAVPLVDDLATLDLDAWARGEGLTRVQECLFGASPIV